MMNFNLFTQDLDIIVGPNKFHNFREAAEIINQKGLGQKNLFKLLREKEILDRYNLPLDDWKESGFFEVTQNRYLTVLISSYGIKYIQKYIL
ncbi:MULTISPECIES: phage antirepressor KilAC domain-containing protein [unclassified Flavobacterium]|uniref:phage antirepressor KilAC domain-containing protein n=1 Tax=unclassified Flavobacterium TaxID=196869 RepID=UPI00131AFF35|nr:MULTISPECIES: phage antirepressor KilAC domain-containing protein [unclassified Flavobacterium]